MKLRWPIALALLLAASATARAQFRKSYFEATKPGAWARYSVSYGGPPTMEYTYRRLPDDAGSVRIQFTMEYKAGPAKGTTFTYVDWMKPGFPIEKDAITYAKWLSKMTIQQGKGKPETKTGKDLTAIAETMTDYGELSSYVASGAVDGKPCDHYAYKWSKTSKPPMVESGNLWLNETVPFGIVKSDMKIQYPKGDTLTTMEWKLVASGAN